VTTPDSVHRMSRALVLGGGGPVGIAWQAGLLVGLGREGVDLSAADFVLGTSAGSNVGARLRLGHDMATVVDQTAVRRVHEHTESSAASSIEDRLGGLMETMIEVAAIADPVAARAHIGAFALGADAGSEDSFVALFDTFEGCDWPTGFACTAIEAASGEFVVWDEDAGTPLQLAVASSCAVPGIFPPVTIKGTRYYDGGLRTPLNADVAAGYEVVVAVSCMSRDMPGSTIVAEVDGLRDGGATAELVEPDAQFVEISGNGMHLMDASRAPAAYDAGVALGKQEAERLGACWR
jgi:NTE family protein